MTRLFGLLQLCCANKILMTLCAHKATETISFVPTFTAGMEEACLPLPKPICRCENQLW